MLNRSVFALAATMSLKVVLAGRHAVSQICDEEVRTQITPGPCGCSHEITQRLSAITPEALVHTVKGKALNPGRQFT